MKKFLFLFMLSGFFLACSNDDSNGGLPVKDVEIPKFENPVKPGESVTIKGEGFTSKSEIWFRALSGKSDVALSGDVKATVTEVTATGITFITPDVYGNQSVLLKEDGKEYLLGTMTFEQRSDGDTEVEILPRKITKIEIYHESVFGDNEYSYNAEGMISEEKRTREGYTDTYVYTYSFDKLVVKNKEDEEDDGEIYTLADGKIMHYEWSENGYSQKCDFTYVGDYLSMVKGIHEEGGKYPFTENFTFAAGKLMHYKYIEDNEPYNYVQLDLTYGEQLNNLNIDLFGVLLRSYWEAVSDLFLVGLNGRRSVYLPEKLSYRYNFPKGDMITETATFKYEMEDGYITTIQMDCDYINSEESGHYVHTYKIFYGD